MRTGSCASGWAWRSTARRSRTRRTDGLARRAATETPPPAPRRGAAEKVRPPDWWTKHSAGGGPVPRCGRRPPLRAHFDRERHQLRQDRRRLLSVAHPRRQGAEDGGAHAVLLRPARHARDELERL